MNEKEIKTLVEKAVENLKETFIIDLFQESNELFNLANSGDQYKFNDIAEKLISILKKKRGVYKVDVEYDVAYRGWTRYTFMRKLIVVSKPCKEFEQLAKWLKKYADFELSYNDIRSERLFGKRNWSEVTDTNYIFQNPKKCAEILSNLRSVRSTKDIIKVDFKTMEDEGDRYNGRGEDRENEWYGSRDRYAVIRVFTPTGRNKKELQFFA